jgi:hypothetical protein
MPKRVQPSSKQSMTIWGSMEAFLKLPTWTQTLQIGIPHELQMILGSLEILQWKL